MLLFIKKLYIYLITYSRNPLLAIILYSLLYIIVLKALEISRESNIAILPLYTP